MEDKSSPSGDDNGPLFVVIWLLVGLVPIPILLATIPPNGGSPSGNLAILFLFCTGCNLAGGIGCLWHFKKPVARIGLGILLGAFFFLLSWGIVLFEACSHMNI